MAKKKRNKQTNKSLQSSNNSDNIPITANASFVQHTDWTPQDITPQRRKKMEEARANLPGFRDAFVKAHLDSALRKFGHDRVLIGADTYKLCVVIPIPAISMEFLFGQSGFPLSTVIQLVAPPKVGKTGLLAEFGRWFQAVSSGIFVLLECESKFNPDWYASFMDPELFATSFIHHHCESIEDWQSRLTHAISMAKEFMVGTTDSPGPGRCVPFLFGIDSVIGKGSEENIDKILGKRLKGQTDLRSNFRDGYASRGHPVEALSISKYFKAISTQLPRWPISIVGVNHVMLGKDEYGNPTRRVPGGEFIKYQESYELELSRDKGPKFLYRAAEFDGYPVRISCYHTSFSGAHRTIVVRLLWWFEDDPVTGQPRQVSMWDWDWSLIELLSRYMGPDSPDPMLRSRLKDSGIHLEVLSSSHIENSCWSRSVGVPKSSPMRWSDVGAMFRQDRQLAAKIRDALCIVKRPFLTGSMDEILDNELKDLV